MTGRCDIAIAAQLAYRPRVNGSGGGFVRASSA
jgi:hypothetical protein